MKTIIDYLDNFSGSIKFESKSHTIYDHALIVTISPWYSGGKETVLTFSLDDKPKMIAEVINGITATRKDSLIANESLVGRVFYDGKLFDATPTRNDEPYADTHAATYVYGTSDDLIELNGAIDIECYAEKAILTFDNGAQLKVFYDDDGIWRVVNFNGHPSITIEGLTGDSYSERGIVFGAKTVEVDIIKKWS